MIQANALNDAFFLFALLCNLLVVGSSFYFKESKIFFLSLLVLAFKVGLCYASVYQVKLFSSLFLPFFFTLFVFLKGEKKIFAPINSYKFTLIAFIVLLSIILEHSTAFLARLSKLIFKEQFFHPVSEIGLVFFLVGGLFLLLKACKNLNFAYLFAFVLLYLPYLFINIDFELASLWLFIYLLYKQYKFAFYDVNTKLPNTKALQRLVKASSYSYLALFKLDNIKNLDSKEQQALEEITISFLSRVLENKLFLYKDGIYATVFTQANEAKQSLEMIREFLNKHSFRLGLKDHKTTISIAFVYIKPDFDLTLESARKCLIRAENEGGDRIISSRESNSSYK